MVSLLFLSPMKRILLGILFVCAVLPVWAVPAVPYPVIYRQADGTEREVLLCGDEAFSFYTSLSGEYLTLRDGFLQPASPTEVAQMRAAQKAPAAMQVSSNFPRSGLVHIPVFLCSFPDKSFTLPDPVAAFSALLNQEGYSAGGATGSVHDYYFQSSLGALNLVFDVFGPFCAAREEAYYGGNSGSSHMRNMSELISDMITQAAAAGVDFSHYDANSDGVVDNVSVFFAGHNEAEGGDESTIWPHQSRVSNGPVYAGKKFSSYLITSELRGANGANMVGIGTYCHEFGHVLGLPDFYNTANNTSSSDEQVYTLGTWDLMCSGSYNNSGRTPPLYSAFERFMMGWQTPIQISEPGLYSLTPLSAGGDAYLLAASTHNLQSSNPNPSEYFLVENRQPVGWEAGEDCLPGHGLLVSHITFNSSSWNNNTFNNSLPLGVDIVEAYSRNPVRSTTTDPFPGSKGITSMTPMLNSGKELSELRLHNIYERTDGVVSFVLGDLQGIGFSFSPAVLDTFVTTFEGRAYEYSTQQLTVSGQGIPTSTISLGFSNRLFQLEADGCWYDSDSAFVDSVRPDGSYERTFTLRFTPRRKSCTPSTSILSVFSADSSLVGQFSLMGIAPRPVYISQPANLMASSVTAKSACISWEPEPDAESYLVQVYTDPHEGVPQFVCEREAVAPDDHLYVFDLQANTAYYALVMAHEEKSCSPNTTLPTDTLRFFTDVNSDSRVALPVVRMVDGSYLLRLPLAAPEGMVLYVYSADGALLDHIMVEPGVRQIQIPLGHLNNNNLYLLKYTTAGGIKRKDYWSKFVYSNLF